LEIADPPGLEIFGNFPKNDPGGVEFGPIWSIMIEDAAMSRDERNSKTRGHDDEHGT
jgi:hypothetical protein